MIRILALILSLSVCLLSSARGESVFLASVHEDKTVSVNSTSTPEKHALTGTKVGKARLVLSAAHSSKPRHKKQVDQRRDQTDYSSSNDLNSRDLSKFKDNESSTFPISRSVFEIRVPGDPRLNFEVRSEISTQASGPPLWIDPKKVQGLSSPGDFLKRLGSIPKVDFAAKEKPLERMEILVSHATHAFRLLAHAKDSSTELLYECKIGLGAPEFPTPVGVYYVTHIYDQDPWWIPPPNRAWAAGDSPSKRVYGGTMAPLLKKRNVLSKKKELSEEDRIEGPVKLEDYGYRFHGTNAPRSIGRNQSHGCVRMISDDARRVASIIKDKVGIADRKESENGSYVILKSPVRLNLVK
jgi:hypothetical protein